MRSWTSVHFGHESDRNNGTTGAPDRINPVKERAPEREETGSAVPERWGWPCHIALAHGEEEC